MSNLDFRLHTTVPVFCEYEVTSSFQGEAGI